MCHFSRTIIDTATNGTLLSKTAEEAQELLEKMASNNYHCANEHSKGKKAMGIHEVDPIVSLSAQV